MKPLTVPWLAVVEPEGVYETVEPIKLPAIDRKKYVRPPMADQTFVPAVYSRHDGVLTVSGGK